MVFPIDSEPQYLDPQIVSEQGAANIIQNCFEGLVTYGENGAVVPAGCESYSVSYLPFVISKNVSLQGTNAGLVSA